MIFRTSTLLPCLWLFLFACADNSKSDNLAKDLQRIEKLRSLDVPLPSPAPGDWLFSHAEKGQTFAQYRQSTPVQPNGDEQKIYLLPIGTFTPAQEKIIQYTAAYLHIFFNLETQVLPPVSDTTIPPSARRKREDGHEQLLTTHLLNHVVPAHRPRDAVVIMAIAEKDLYPRDDWNFVFGQARLKQGLGVSSMYRYCDTNLDSVLYQQCLGRMIKTSAHEIGHMFSCQHCTHAVCLMNGSNSLSEADARPNRLCSECMQKMQWNLKFDLLSRYEQLDHYFRQHRLNSDRLLVLRDWRHVAK